MMRSTLLALLIVAIASSAGAQNAAKRARKAFRAGQRHAELGHFEDAIAAFERAYKLKPMPAILFNIGQCHKYLKNYERALYFFEEYLRKEPDAPDRKIVRQELREAKRLKRAQEEAATDEVAVNGSEGASTDATDTQRQVTDSASEDQGADGSEADDGGSDAVEVDGAGADDTGADGAEGGLTTDGTDVHLQPHPAVTPPTTEPVTQRALWEEWWFWTAAGVVVTTVAVATVVALQPEAETIAPAGSLGTIDVTP